MPQKADFLGPISCNRTLKKEKERKKESEKEERRRREKKECLHSWFLYWLLFDAKGPFGGNVFKNLYVFHFLSFFIFETEFFGTIKGDDQEIQIIE